MYFGICGYCIRVLEKERPGLKNQLEAVAASMGIKLSHGTCIDHVIEQYRSAGFPEDRIQASIRKVSNEPQLPDLRKHPELVQAYLQGNFGRQVNQQQMQQAVTECLKKLTKILKGR